MRRIVKSAVGIVLTLNLLLLNGCSRGSSTVNTLIEKSDLDTSKESIIVNLKESERYSNPISDENQPYRADSLEAQRLSGVAEEKLVLDQSKTGDPYILRYNGKYYLYCSTDAWYCSYRCWESTDLMHYTFLGEFSLLDQDGNRVENDTAAGQGYELECPWAPEVHYWNGQFYMYTSLHAAGHKVFLSTTGLPYGEFRVVNNNFAPSIDGTMFIDDNEDKWFIRCNREDGTACPVITKVSDMYTVADESDYSNVSRTGITGDQVEGPFMFKRNGIYYFITTGEGAGEPAYRLNYAYNTSGLGKELNIGDVVNSDNWLTEMQPNLILNTEGDYFGYGHGAVTVGPDLDSYWFPYHMSRSSGKGRVLGINRIEFSGTRMNIIGQDKETFVPDAPAFYTSYYNALTDTDYKGDKSGVIARSAGYRSYTEERTNAGEGLYQVDGKLLSGNSTTQLIKTGSTFTAEYNFKDVATNGTFKCLFGGGYVTINGKKIELYKGNSKIAEADMLVNGESWDWSAYHSIVVTCEPGRITVTVDGCTKIDEEATGFGNDAIGYEGATLSQIGGAVFSNQAFGSSDNEVAKTVDGSFFASNYYTAKDGESATELSDNSKVYRVETKGNEDKCNNNSVYNYYIYKDATALKMVEGDRAVYVIDVSHDGLYSIESLFSNNSDGSVIKIQIDNDKPTCYTLRKNDYSKTTGYDDYYKSLQFQKRLIDEIHLKKGLHTFTVKVVQGNYTAIEYELNHTSENAPEYSDKLDKKSGHDYFSNWSIKDGAYYASNGQKSLVRFGGSEYTNYGVKVDLKTEAMNSRSNKAGIILRLTDPSVFYRQTYGSGHGYFVCLDAYGVSLERIDYNERLVAYYETTLSKDKYYTLEAECIDNTITVYLDGEKVITYIDPYGYSRGATALYSYQAATYFKNLQIIPK